MGRAALGTINTTTSTTWRRPRSLVMGFLGSLATGAAVAGTAVAVDVSVPEREDTASENLSHIVSTVCRRRWYHRRMALDPKKWTVKTQEAVRRRDRPRQGAPQPRAHARPPVGRPRAAGRHDRAAGAAKLGQAPRMVRNRGRRGRRQAAPGRTAATSRGCQRELNACSSAPSSTART